MPYGVGPLERPAEARRCECVATSTQGSAGEDTGSGGTTDGVCMSASGVGIPRHSSKQGR